MRAARRCSPAAGTKPCPGTWSSPSAGMASGLHEYRIAGDVDGAQIGMPRHELVRRATAAAIVVVVVEDDEAARRQAMIAVLQAQHDRIVPVAVDVSEGDGSAAERQRVGDEAGHQADSLTVDLQADGREVVAD